MEDLNDLYYFAQVVEHGGFAPAGRALGEPKSKLSRRIAALEEHLGVRLIQRSTRHFSVTEIGQDYHRHCLAMLVEAEGAAEVIERHRAEPQGRVRLSCPTALLNFWVGPMLAEFMLRYPLVELQVEATNRQVDLIQEGFDIALRVRFPPLEGSELVMKVLGESRQMVVGAPALRQRLGQRLGQRPSPTEVAALPTLHWGSPQRDYQWQLDGPDGVRAQARYQPRLITDDLMALRQAAVAGVGAVHLPSVVVREQLADGSLVNLLPDWAPRTGIVHAVYPSRRGLLPSVRGLLDFLGQGFAHSDMA
ncbi:MULTISPECIES: LysR family transcriptional regulator [unclassified Pseudomonas]|uniref:LysR family transcriptional regulator n=1 Tax=unclassified Pseudomonas TaxID=196821 RepID=UPI0002A410E0|nr:MULTISPECIES: LysR family transcriptional regulator [unclassified Pseudomonas]NTX92831.1 LysR family transcriptional regulator [Pseudomonas sp. UMA643]NTY22113.1 LysR family transcriptional regulator [Pseudomonas sp. UMC3103]NTY28411.1 LysR family transcriptional regulator [Pseudomonas sp. UMA603]NTY32457.1 LysR family transcriptional regulator [Pseudomonas sp. UMC3129]NTY57266.1 LysR family transcriptional regulator [Pseudomonas sp. UMC631]NTY67450.1 LysR family transcriptional regulator 